MEYFAAVLIATHGVLYWFLGMALLFRCVRDNWVVFIEEQLQVNSKKEDIEADIIERPEAHRLALRFAAYIMVFVGGLRTSIAFNDSCVIVIILAHTFVSENLLLCNEMLERRFRGIGWIGCVFVVNAALVGLVAVSAWNCARIR